MEDGLYAMRFLVDEQPYCLWDWNPKLHNDTFIESFDSYYFEYLARSFIATATDEDVQRFAIATRSAYSQALETFFAVLSATLQAPFYIPGWLLQYKIGHLRRVVQKMHSGQPLNTILELESVSWENIITALHPTLFLDEQNGATLKDSMIHSWSSFAIDFLSEEAKMEYNSIKHGFRIRPGGLEMGLSSQPNIPLEEMPIHIESKFGSSYLSAERIPEAPRYHLQIKDHQRNWYPQDMLYGLSLLSLSLYNILQFNRWYNGHEPNDQKWPEDLSQFGNPWEFAHTLSAVSVKRSAFELTAANITQYSEKDIFAIYEGEEE